MEFQNRLPKPCQDGPSHINHNCKSIKLNKFDSRISVRACLDCKIT